MNRKNLVLIPTVLLITIVFFNSCIKDVGKLPVVTPVPVNVCDSATYDFKIKAIVDKKCKSCHSPAGGPSGSINLTDYTQVKSAADAGRIKARVIDANPGIMPPVGDATLALTPSEKTLIQCWLDKGSPQ